MARWIAFDQDTVMRLRSQLPQDSVFEAPGRSALEYALNSTRPVVVLLEAAGGDETTVALFRPTALFRATRSEEAVPSYVEEPASTVHDEKPVRATGFLGLSDDFIGADEEEDGDKRRWWQFWR
jgi:hypothetical protein